MPSAWIYTIVSVIVVSLIPELKRDCEAITSLQQLLAIVLGLTTTTLLVFLE